jgi:hypothetical protein
VVLINEAPDVFKRGESRAVSLVPVETALQAGEHKLQILPGKVVAFTERQLQFLDEFRRVFLIHITPGATQPFVSTILDAAPHVVPR